MASRTDRNPSPPPEILKNDEDFVPDRVGDSVYSKQWLYKTLMSIVGAFNGEMHARSKDNEEDNPDAGITEDANDNDIVELDPKVEEDACTLWDMSASNEVAQFLCDCGVADIFLEVIEKTKSPRLLEIVVGILGNMSSFDSVCQTISKNKTLLHSLILLSGTSDSPTLLQLFRLINCGVANENSRNLWFDVFEEDSFFMENMKFILENNLNSAVLKSAFEVLDRILNEHLTYCYMWGHESYTHAVIEAGKQLLKSHCYEDLDQFFCMVYTLCQYPPNVKTYVDQFDTLHPVFREYFLKLGQEETLPKESRLSDISCSFASYALLLNCEHLKSKVVVVGTNVLKSIRKITLSVNSLLMGRIKENIDTDPRNVEPSCSRLEERHDDEPQITENEYDSWAVLVTAAVCVAQALTAYVTKESDKFILEDIMNSEVPETLKPS